MHEPRSRQLRAEFAPLDAVGRLTLVERFPIAAQVKDMQRVLVDGEPAAVAAFFREDAAPAVALLFDAPHAPTAAEDAWTLALGRALGADARHALAWIPHADAGWSASLFEALGVLLPWSQTLPRAAFVRVLVTRRRFEIALRGASPA